MPETASANDFYQVRVQGTILGQQMENVLHFRIASAMDDVELRLILALAQCYVLHLMPKVTNQLFYNRIVWKRVSPTLGIEHVTVPADFDQGAATGDALPSFNSVVLSLRTALGGRSHRGRMYLAGIPESGASGNNISNDTGFQDAVIAFAACLATKFINIGDPVPANAALLQVYSRKLGGSTFPYTASAFTGVETITVNTAIGTTRSRKVGHGG